ncbi:MAG: ABC transporter permease subunit [Flavobacteriales bacterium]|nr:ABC transporter permease subunit [Flavobacteriales bacterium]
MIIFSESTINRWISFKKIKRSYYSFLILSIAYLLSLFSHFIAIDKPLIMKYNVNYYFPSVFFYQDLEFGGDYKTEADYTSMIYEGFFKNESNWCIQPIIPHDPLHSYLESKGVPPHAPSLVHWVGTDISGRDILSRLIHGFRICMSFAISLTIISTIIGIIIGGVQGYFAGRVDIYIQRAIEIWSTLPFLYIVILIGSIYGRSFTMLIIVMSLFQWIGLSYYMRGEFLKIKNYTYIKAAKSLGLSNINIFFSEILPNAITPVITIAPFSLIGSIGALTALDFLGFGLQPPTPSWGELLSQGLQSLYAPWITISAVTALFITLLLATFIGEGVREAFDPKGNRAHD